MTVVTKFWRPKIQEYSRVICSALLNPANVAPNRLARFLESARNSEHSQKVLWAIEPIAAHEARCQAAADDGEVELLCDFLEQASYIEFVRCPEAIANVQLRIALAETKSRLDEVGLSESPGSLVVRYYGGVYFSFVQAARIDALLEAAAKLPASERDVFLAAILSTASEVVNTVGKQFAQPIRPRDSEGKPKKKLAKRVARDRFADVFEVFESWILRYLATSRSERKHQIIRADYKEALSRLSNSVGVVYADPPYQGRSLPDSIGLRLLEFPPATRRNSESLQPAFLLRRRRLSVQPPLRRESYVRV